jgi:hypothetical protein
MMLWTPYGATLALVTISLAVDPVEVKGNKFFHKDGSQFFLKGHTTRSF